MTEIVFPTIVRHAFSNEDSWMLAGYLHKNAGLKTVIVKTMGETPKILHFATILPNHRILDINGIQTDEELISAFRVSSGETVVLESIESFDDFLSLTDDLIPIYSHSYTLNVIAVAVLEKYAPSFLPRLKT